MVFQTCSKQPDLWPPIPPTVRRTILRDAPEPRRSLAVVPLSQGQRYYGEAPARFRRGHGGMGGQKRTRFPPMGESEEASQAPQVLQPQKLKRITQQSRRKPSANPQGILLVVVLVIVIETSQVEHEDENDDEDDPQSRSAESIRLAGAPPGRPR